MLYAEEGTNETFVYSERSGLNDWTITISGRDGREKIESTIDMVVTGESDKRVYLEWVAPQLGNLEFDYVIKAGDLIIDKGILRNGLV